MGPLVLITFDKTLSFLRYLRSILINPITKKVRVVTGKRRIIKYGFEIKVFSNSDIHKILYKNLY